MIYVKATFSLLTLFGICAASAQVNNEVAPAPNAPRFEVVSIRKSAPHSEGWSQQMTPDSVMIKGNLKQLIRFAYGTKIDFILGGARWTDDFRFDLNAKVAPEDVATLQVMTLGQRKAMLQGVLTEQFGLKTHLEPRSIPVYRLRKVARGPELRVHKSEDNRENDLLTLPGSITLGSHELSGEGITIATLIRMLEPVVQLTILDDSGLNGRYDMHLKWSPDCTSASLPNEGTETCHADSTDPSPSILTALQEQLGVKLVPGKGIVQKLVIDEAHLPTEN